MSVALYNRQAILRVDKTLIEGLRIKFEVQKTADISTNTAVISVYNLAPKTRDIFNTALLKRTELVECSLLAGYQGSAPQQIFLGNIVRSESSRQQVEWVTKFSAGDGEKEKATARVSVTLTQVTQGRLLEYLADATGLSRGNLHFAMQRVKDQIGLARMLEAVSITGSPFDKLVEVSQQVGMNVSIQDRQLHFTTARGVSVQEVPIISAASGMIGSPEIANSGMVKVKCLIQPQLVPMRPLYIASNQVNGMFRIERVDFSGDTHGVDWFADLELANIDGTPPATPVEHKRPKVRKVKKDKKSKKSEVTTP